MRRNPYREQPSNIYGEKLTLAARIDRRQYYTPKRENNGEAYCYYDVLERPGDRRPWYVMCTVIATGERYRVAKYTTQRKAENAAERYRIAQPNRRASAKLKHKIGAR